ncbi:MAG: hypothetical protein HZC40_01080 [Chloroflexi bacterium]|nr:hypothetical protein [Chloroflexota bacterium]
MQTLDPLANAILQTLDYADLFEYALSPDQVQRYLIGVRATRDDITRALSDPARLNGAVLRRAGFLALADRDASITARIAWRNAAQRQMPRARFYARLLANFPFVRMIALTGGLAMENARDNDIDFLIVTAPGRLWLTRGLIVALVRLARIGGDKVCPNFILTENALTIPDQNLYTAHEIAQMIPLSGFGVYRKMRTLNAWAENFLPNANSANELPDEQPQNRLGAFIKNLGERLFGGRFGARIERWEMRRKIAKLSAQIPAHADGVEFSAEVCRGFFSGHAARIMNEFQKRTANV